MPIYAYRCESCGFAKDVLQKISDAVLTDCPACGQASFHKQVTAAGFQLKGSGWYVTDFRDGKAAKPAAAGGVDSAAAGGADSPAAGAADSAGSASAAGQTAASPAPAAAPAAAATPSAA